VDPHAGSVGLNAGGRGFAGAAMGAHTRTVGHHGQPSGVWGPGGRPKGGARELPFPMAAECAVGAQRVKVEHPRAEGPPPVSYLDARSGDGHNRAAGKGNQQPNHPPGAHPVSGLGADILEMIIKNEIQDTVEEEIQEDIGDFSEARGDTHTSEAEVRRDASLYIINQIIDSEDTSLSIDDLKSDDKQSLALVGEDEDERVATGSHEVYSRDRSTLDSGLREILESQEIPPGQGNSVPADEFMGNYTESHGEQYNNIVENLRVDKPSDIAELAGRSPD